MTKYSEIIAQMTLEQKAHLLTASNGWNKIVAGNLSISGMAFSDIDRGLRIRKNHKCASAPTTCFPSPTNLARSWDLALTVGVADRIGNEAQALGVNALCIFDGAHLSEDAYLSGKMLSAYVRGVQRNKVIASVQYGTANMSTDEKELREKELTPYEMAVKEGRAAMVCVPYGKFGGLDMAESSHLIEGVLNTEWQYNGIVTAIDGGVNVALAMRMGINMIISSNPTEAAAKIVKAVSRYRKLKSDIALGNATDDKLIAAMGSGEVLSESVVDELLERLLTAADGVELCPAEGTEYSTYPVNHTVVFDEQEHGEYAVAAAAESAVLLKNNGVLPLSSETKVAFVGEYVFSPLASCDRTDGVVPMENDVTVNLLHRSGIEVIGCAKGFERGANAVSATALSGEAAELAWRADVTVMYLGSFTRIDALPAEQLSLLTSIKNSGTRVVAVYFGELLSDMSWCDLCDAVLFAGDLGQGGAKAVLKLLSGALCPSGKLTRTVCDAQTSLDYRRCQADNIEERFAFGHGLSYTSFTYSDLSVTSSGVSFTLTNSGACDGAEVVQLYIGKEGSAVWNARKELKGFKKVRLAVGESRTVNIPFDSKSFRYYNTDTRSWEIEGGVYQIYVAASSRDIRLFEDIEVTGSGAAVPMPSSVPAEEPVSVKPVKKTGAIIGAVLSGALFIALTVLATTYIVAWRDELFRLFSVRSGSGVRPIIDSLLGVVWVGGTVALLMWLAFNLGKLLDGDKAAKVIAHKPFDAYRPDRVYPNDWEETEEVVAITEDTAQSADYATAEDTPKSEPAPEYTNKFVKVSFSRGETLGAGLKKLYANFADYTEKRCIDVDKGELIELFAAMMSSRVIVLRTDNTNASAEVLRSFAECFDASLAVFDMAGVENISELVRNESAQMALANAQRLNVVFVTGADISDLGAFLGDARVDLPSNVWLVTAIDEDRAVCVGSACVSTLHANAENAIDTETAIATAEEQVTLNIYPLDTFALGDAVSRARQESYLSEKYWRKIDRLEEHLSTRIGFRISNKAVNAMERYLAAAIACDMEQTDAMDAVLSSLVLTRLDFDAAEVLGKGEETFTDLMDSVFGADKDDRCRKLLRVMGIK